MTLKVKKKIIFLFLLSFFYFCPVFWDNFVVSLIRNTLFFLALGYILLHHIKPDWFIVSVIAYYVVLHTLTAINGHVYSNMIVTSLKACIYIWFLKGMIEEDRNQTTDCLYYVFLFYCVANFLSVVFMPEGIYETRTLIDIWNGYHVYGNWFFGNKNTQLCWFLVLVLLCFVRVSTYRKNCKITQWLIAIISVFNMILIDTSTSTFVLVVASAAMILFSGRSRLQYLDVNSHIILVGYLVLEVLLVFGMLTFLGPFVQEVFGKDLSFSGRATAVWPKVLLFIAQKPLYGHGIIDSNTSAQLMNNVALVNAHNEVLQILWQGGVLLLAIVILVFHRVGSAINTISIKREKLFMCVLLSAYLVGTLFEVMSSGYVFLILVALFYYSPVLLDNQCKTIGTQCRL